MPIALIVDDSKTDQALIRELINKEEIGWIVDFSNSAEEAIAYLEEIVVDVVVTDMRMPGMSGLELLDYVRQAHPRLPVILITAHDDESIAVEALRKGAASYVPKRELGSRLTEVITQVVHVADNRRDFDSLFESAEELHLRLKIVNDPQLLDPLVSALDTMAYRMHLCSERGRQRIGVAVDEALLNAMYHGNLELPAEELPDVRTQLRNGQTVDLIEQRRKQPPFSDRYVRIDATFDPEKARVIVSDDGSGFESSLIADDDVAHFADGGHHGLVLIRSLMDEVTFHKNGSEIVMTKYKEEEPETAQSPAQALRSQPAMMALTSQEPKRSGPTETAILPDLDISAALEYAVGDEDLLAVVLDVCVEETPQLIAGLQLSLTNGKAAEVQRFAHTIRGTLRMFPNSPIESNAAAIEEMVLAKQFANADVHLKAIEASWTELSSQIDSYLTKRRIDSQNDQAAE